MNSADDTTAFVDVYLNYLACDIQPTVSIDDCYTTCATDIIGMHMTANRGTPQKSIVRVFDEAFNKIGPLLTEKVVVRPSLQKGSMKLELKGKVPIASQKYEVSIQNEGDKTKMNPEIEFVNGKLFNLAATPSFVSFTTPEHPPVLVGAKAHLVATDQPLAFVSLMLHTEAKGFFDVVVEEEGKDVVIAVEFDELSLMGDSSTFVVVGEDRLLTHDTTYTIKSITPTPGTESPVVWMNDTISFHIPKSTYVPPKEPTPDPEDPEPEPEDPKKTLSPETKKLLSWLIPLVASLLVVLVIVIVILVLVNRRKTEAETLLKEMEDQADDRIDEKVEVETVAPDNTNAAIHAEAISHSNFGPNSSSFTTEVGSQQFSKNDTTSGLVEVMKCSGDFTVTTARMDTTLYSIIHTEKKELRNRAIGMQIVNGLKHVATHRGCLGLILWEIETGLVPSGEVDAIVAQKQSGTGIPPNMSDLHDEEFVAMLTRCLSVNPKERPTLTEVGEFLSSHQHESGIAESRYDMKTQVG
ncbi:hypothetical protein BLNAU_14407 [Blattamonas nauphoetae]|uniref:Protein kinase domain-containing protein n=1 Tax=Blattamonas nauphoetae TaxID=2049346 RepID=A0ABQ9XE45_9EUKA|nr:hypothetical protein BLNAU_14407 [Blattamonas nauphoetae]